MESIWPKKGPFLKWLVGNLQDITRKTKVHIMIRKIQRSCGFRILFTAMVKYSLVVSHQAVPDCNQNFTRASQLHMVNDFFSLRSRKA